MEKSAHRRCRHVSKTALADIRRISRSWGKTAVGLGIVKQRGTNAVEVANGVKQRMEELQKNLPAGMHLDVVFDATQFIKDSVNELKFNLMLSIILTSLVCYLFLGSWSANINVLLSIPFSIVGAFLHSLFRRVYYQYIYHARAFSGYRNRCG